MRTMLHVVEEAEGLDSAVPELLGARGGRGG